MTVAEIIKAIFAGITIFSSFVLAKLLQLIQPIYVLMYLFIMYKVVVDTEQKLTLHQKNIIKILTSYFLLNFIGFIALYSYILPQEMLGETFALILKGLTIPSVIIPFVVVSVSSWLAYKCIRSIDRLEYVSLQPKKHLIIIVLFLIIHYGSIYLTRFR